MSSSWINSDFPRNLADADELREELERDDVHCPPAPFVFPEITACLRAACPAPSHACETCAFNEEKLAEHVSVKSHADKSPLQQIHEVGGRLEMWQDLFTTASSARGNRASAEFVAFRHKMGF